MATIAEDRQPIRVTAGHVLVGSAGLILVGTAVWFAVSWVDMGTDSTCGAVVHPNMWLGANGGPGGCSSVMAMRALISVALAATGLVLLYAAVTKLDRLSKRALAVFAVATGFSLVLLVINEIVRSGGRF